MLLLLILFSGTVCYSRVVDVAVKPAAAVWLAERASETDHPNAVCSQGRWYVFPHLQMPYVNTAVRLNCCGNVVCAAAAYGLCRRACREAAVARWQAVDQRQCQQAGAAVAQIMCCCCLNCCC